MIQSPWLDPIDHDACYREVWFYHFMRTICVPVKGKKGKKR